MKNQAKLSNSPNEDGRKQSLIPSVLGLEPRGTAGPAVSREIASRSTHLLLKALGLLSSSLPTYMLAPE